MQKFVVTILFMLCMSPWAFAQSIYLQVKGDSIDLFTKTLDNKTSFENFEACDFALKNAKSELFKQGYLAVSIDSLQQKDSTFTAFIFVGKKYSWAQIRTTQIPNEILNQLKIEPRIFFNKPITNTQMNTLFEKLVRHYENNGYPFCAVQLDSIEEDAGKISATVNLQKGPLVKLDSVILDENAPISKNYVLHYLGLKEGMLYDERKIKNMSTKLRQLAFLQESFPWRVQFNANKTKLNLSLKSKSANQADILIGLMPNNNELNGKFLLTGDVKLALVNAMNYGESVQVNWQNLQYKSPRYNIKFQLPYLLNTDVVLSGKFDFYKKDTSFKTINGHIGLQYQFTESNYVKMYYELFNSRLITVNTASLIATRKLPNNADVNYKTIGIEILKQQLDLKNNPRKGYLLFVNAGLSFRSVLKNTTIEQTFDAIANKPFAYLYDTLALKNNKYQVFARVQKFTKLDKRFTIASFIQAGFVFSNKTLFKNELFQIGGYRLLRGYDEGSLFVKNYQVLTVEPRFLLSPNSYIFLFTDVARIDEVYKKPASIWYPYSIGMGMSFETKAGMFNISYAVGSQQNIGLQFKNSKIHFGYINYF